MAVLAAVVLSALPSTLLAAPAQADTPGTGGSFCSHTVDGRSQGSTFVVVAKVTCTSNVFGIDISGTVQRGGTLVDQSFSKTCRAGSAPGLTCTFTKSYPNPAGQQTWTVATWWTVYNIPADPGTTKSRVTTLYG